MILLYSPEYYILNYEVVMASVVVNKNKQYFHVLGDFGEMSEQISLIVVIPFHSESMFLE